MNPKFYLVCLLLAGGCGSLKVTKIDSSPQSNTDGIPYYMSRQDFVISELGLDEKGNEVGDKVLRVDLVTKPDLNNGFLIRNSPAPFANSEFEIVRDTQGRLVSLAARSEDKTKETVEALVSLVVKAAAFAGAEADSTNTLDSLDQQLKENIDKKEKLDAELKVLKEKIKTSPNPTTDDLLKLTKLEADIKTVGQVIKKIPLQRELLVLNKTRNATYRKLEELAKDPAKLEASSLKGFETSLEKLSARIAAVQSDLNANESSKGVTKSGTRPAKVLLVKDAKEAEEKAAQLKEDEVGIFVIKPSEPESATSKANKE